MPKIPWTGLPAALRDHLFERLRERKITAEDLYQLKLWRESEPDAPDGLWYKDFGTFKICREGKLPNTLFARGPGGKGYQALRPHPSWGAPEAPPTSIPERAGQGSGP